MMELASERNLIIACRGEFASDLFWTAAELETEKLLRCVLFMP